MYSDIVETIKEYECKGYFTYSDVEENIFSLAEEELGISIPSQYLWFLKEYGHGGLNGIEILGVGKNRKMIFKDVTLKYRTYGLPHNLIVIENCDEWVYCIDSLSGKVKMWSQGKNKADEAYETFIDYLNDRIEDAIENL